MAIGNRRLSEYKLSHKQKCKNQHASAHLIISSSKAHSTYYGYGQNCTFEIALLNSF